MKGIYKFQNNINKKVYIGQTRNLSSREKQHHRNYLNPNSSMYNTKFYRALRKYGYDNFSYQILVEDDNLTSEELNYLEEYYIMKVYNSYYCGYNSTKGGDNTSVSRKLDEEQVLHIKEKLKTQKNTIREISKIYNVSESLISMINSGIVWDNIGTYDYPIYIVKEKANKGEKNPRAMFSDQEVLKIRTRFMKETLPEIYEDYKNFCSFSEMKKICYGVHFKHLPQYKKREKRWVLDGTCIDYSGLQK